MKAVVLQEGNKFGLEEVPEPALKKNDDVMVQVTAAAICGSDVHAKHGLIPGIPIGTIMGHEFVGKIVEVGSDVTRFNVGDRVAVPPGCFCGICEACRRGEIQYCTNGGVWGGGEMFGPDLQGAQTSYVRVPFADRCLTPIPDSVTDEQAVFVGDVFSTGYYAALEGHIQTGDTVVIFGCGPIGLGALISAWQFGPRQVFAVDLLDNRLDLAKHYGATVIDIRQGDAVEQLKEMTGGRLADVAIEAIGNPVTFGQSLKSVRRGGKVSVIGLFPFQVELPIHELSFYSIKISMGLADVSHVSELMGLIESGRVDLRPLATHEFPLEQAMDAYELFENHKDQCLKVLIKP